MDPQFLSKPDPEFQEASKHIQLPDLTGDYKQTRAVLSQLKAQLAASRSEESSDITIEYFKVAARDGYQIPVKSFTPKSAPSGGSPLVVMIHGGGFVLGDIDGEDVNCRQFTRELGCVCLSIDYRLAPENPFPAAVNDCWDAVKWAAANAEKLEANPARGFIVGGTSAGGNLTDVCGHLARDEALSPPLTGLLEMIPALCSRFEVPEEYKAEFLSFEQNKDAPILGKGAIDLFEELYKPDAKSPLFSSLINPKGHGGLPPVYLQVCGMDPLRDDALVYEKILRTKHEIPTKLDVYPGLPHGFWNVLPNLKSSKKFIQDTLKGAEWLLSFSK